MSDLSVRTKNAGSQRLVDALLRASGASSAVVLIPSSTPDSADAGQLGLDSPAYQALQLAPVIFRRVRPTMRESEPSKYELLVSASAVELQIGVTQFSSAQAFFQSVASVSVSGLELLIESWACSTALGQPVLYRLLLRSAD